MSLCNTRSTVPIVCADVNDSRHLKFSQNGEASDSKFIGVINVDDSYDDRVDLVFTLKPDIRNVLIVCDPEAERSESVSSSHVVSQAFARYGVETSICDYRQFDNVSVSALRPEHMNADVIFMLRQTQVMNAVERIARFAEGLRTPLIASDLGSTKVGAAIGCGYSDVNLGAQTARFSYRILRHEQTHLIEFIQEPLCLALSEANMVRQGLVLTSDGYEHAYKHKEVLLPHEL